MDKTEENPSLQRPRLSSCISRLSSSEGPLDSQKRRKPKNYLANISCSTARAKIETPPTSKRISMKCRLFWPSSIQSLIHLMQRARKKKIASSTSKLLFSRRPLSPQNPARPTRWSWIVHLHWSTRIFPRKRGRNRFSPTWWSWTHSWSRQRPRSLLILIRTT